MGCYKTYFRKRKPVNCGYVAPYTIVVEITLVMICLCLTNNFYGILCLLDCEHDLLQVMLSLMLLKVAHHFH